jgi:hypothetical protein
VERHGGFGSRTAYAVEDLMAALPQLTDLAREKRGDRLGPTHEIAAR